VRVPQRLLPARSVGKLVCVVVAIERRLYQPRAVDTEQLGNRIMPKRQEDLAD
jgi:hypothetical protein